MLLGVSDVGGDLAKRVMRRFFVSFAVEASHDKMEGRGC